MKLNVNKWYKNPNLLAITTQTNKHICNIFLSNLLQIDCKYDAKNGTLYVGNLFELLDHSYQIFETHVTKLHQNVKSAINKIAIKSQLNHLSTEYVKNENSWIDTFDFNNINNK
jgi:hypothetical protein